MKKKLLGLSVLGAMVLTLASCNEAEETTNTESSEASATTVTETTSAYKLSVVAPQGAPAAAVANLAVNDKDSYSFIGASTISEQFTANEKDIIIAPVNAGAKLYKAGKSTYKLGAVVTWGNLYFATQRTDVSSISDLSGKSVTLFGDSTINSSIAKYVLEESDVTPTYADSLTAASDTQQLLLSDANAIVLTAEPALSAAAMKLGSDKVTSFSVSDLFSSVTDGAEFTQAGLFIKADTITNHKSELDNYLEELKNAITLVNTDLDTTANNIIALGNTGLPDKTPVIKSALPKCNIKYVSATDAKASLERTAGIDIKQFGGAVPQDDFYYSK